MRNAVFTVWSLILPTSFKLAVKFTPSEDCGATGDGTRLGHQKQVTQDASPARSPRLPFAPKRKLQPTKFFAGWFAASL